MPILFFILWLLLAGEVTLHVCLWGVVASALLSCFCHQVLGYRLSPRRGTLGKGLSFLKYLGASRGGDAAGGFCGDASDLYPGQKDGAQADLV